MEWRTFHLVSLSRFTHQSDRLEGLDSLEVKIRNKVSVGKGYLFGEAAIPLSSIPSTPTSRDLYLSRSGSKTSAVVTLVLHYEVLVFKSSFVSSNKGKERLTNQKWTRKWNRSRWQWICFFFYFHYDCRGEAESTKCRKTNGKRSRKSFAPPKDVWVTRRWGNSWRLLSCSTSSSSSHGKSVSPEWTFVFLLCHRWYSNRGSFALKTHDRNVFLSRILQMCEKKVVRQYLLEWLFIPILNENFTLLVLKIELASMIC